MEHFAGGTVADRLRGDGPIPVPLALRWLRETASALDAAHAADIVHRDVKPGNLLLDENGRLGVGDFGIASLAGETQVTIAGQVLGTAAYLSPEQARGRAATPASDRFSLAVVAYELLCGRRPFVGRHADRPGPRAGRERPHHLDRPLAARPPTRCAGACRARRRTGRSRRARSSTRWRTRSARRRAPTGVDGRDAGARRATPRLGPEWNDREHPRFARGATARRSPSRCPPPRAPRRSRRSRSRGRAARTARPSCWPR